MAYLVVQISSLSSIDGGLPWPAAVPHIELVEIVEFGAKISLNQMEGGLHGGASPGSSCPSKSSSRRICIFCRRISSSARCHKLCARAIVRHNPWILICFCSSWLLSVSFSRCQSVKASRSSPMSRFRFPLRVLRCRVDPVGWTLPVLSASLFLPY